MKKLNQFNAYQLTISLTDETVKVQLHESEDQHQEGMQYSMLPPCPRAAEGQCEGCAPDQCPMSPVDKTMFYWPSQVDLASISEIVQKWYQGVPKKHSFNTPKSRILHFLWKRLMSRFDQTGPNSPWLTESDVIQTGFKVKSITIDCQLDTEEVVSIGNPL